MTIDPEDGTEWMVDLEGWGSNLPVAGLWPALPRLSGRLLARHDSLAASLQLEARRGRPSGDARGKGLNMGDGTGILFS